MRFVLLPTLSNEEEFVRQRIQQSLRKRWAKLVALGILFLLVSGIYTIVTTITGFKKISVELPGYYHLVFAIKFLLALIIFFIASAMAGKSPGTEPMRQKPKLWLTINVALAIVVVCLSGTLRMAHSGPNVSEKPAAKNVDQNLP